MSKKKKKINSKNYFKKIKIEFIPDKEAENMLRKNCSYRHFLYNKCVEIVKSMEENHPKGHIGDFSEYDLLAYIRDLYESNIIFSYRDELRPDWMEDYDYYFRGISECVVDDIMRTIHRILTERRNGNVSQLNFRKFNPNRMSFRFKNKIHTERKPNKNGLYHGNSIVLTENPYLIGIKINNTYGHPLGIRLKESINKFDMNLNMIKYINFLYHNEKWFIIFCEEKEKIDRELINIKYKSKDLAGIDLGETNPVVIYDGKRIKHIPKHLQYPKDRIKKVETRIKRLQACMDRKYNPEMDKFHQSKNYYKVLKKFHKAWEHLVNIKKDWHFKLAHWIVTHYRNIVVDEFHDYTKKVNSDYVQIVRKSINRSYQDKAVGIFNIRLIHMCHKYGTNYYRVVKDNSKESQTTNTCNQCGNVNEHKLDLDHRIFKCESCGYTIDRDVNAAINCYNLYNNKSTRNLFLELNID